jgi:hypothetical protein
MDTHEVRARRLLAFAAELISMTPEELEAERQRRTGARMLALVSSEDKLPNISRTAQMCARGVPLLASTRNNEHA